MLRAEFPDITTLYFVQSSIKDVIQHFINTKGQPIHACAWHLPPDALVAAKFKFDKTDRPVSGLHHCIWYSKLQEAGIFVETTDVFMM